MAAVPPELVQAALRAAEELGRQVGGVPAAAIAAQAGISRGTLRRRLSASRAALEEAVRAAGVDPGAQPVRVRALDAAAELISGSGLAPVTMEAIAARANCSVDSQYAVFGGRAELLGAVFERHARMLEIQDILDSQDGYLTHTVRRVYGQLTETFSRQPRVAPAMLAEALAGAAARAARHRPGLGAWRADASHRSRAWLVQSRLHDGRLAARAVGQHLRQRALDAEGPVSGKDTWRGIAYPAAFAVVGVAGSNLVGHDRNTRHVFRADQVGPYAVDTDA